MPNYQSAGVYVLQKDLSQVVATTSTSVGAIVLYASKGQIGQPVLVNSTTDFISKFGYPHPSRGFGAYAALAFLAKSNQLFVSRVVSGAYAYAGIKITNTTGVVTGTGTGQNVPSNVTLAATDAFYLYAIGPGAYANTLQAEIVSQNMASVGISTTTTANFTQPAVNSTVVVSVTSSTGFTTNQTVYVVGGGSYTITATATGTLTLKNTGATGNAAPATTITSGAVVSSVVLTTAATGGSLAAGTYSYRVSALNALGQTLASTAINITTTGTTSTVTINIPRVAGANNYNIYGRAAGTEGLMTSVLQPSTGNATFTDDGVTYTPSATVLASGITAYTATNVFTINIYDTAISLSKVQETFQVTLAESLDGYGQQQEIETRVNGLSNLVRVYKNPTYTGVSYFQSMSATNFASGADGDAYSAVSDGTFTTGWSQYADKETITVRLLIEGGRGSPAVQQYMDSLAAARQDCVCILDVPSLYQEATAAVQYRNVSLNLNSSRSTLYTPDLQINDPYNDLVLYVPPSGYIAGVYAYTDFVSNAWYAPAGLNRGLISVLGLRYKYNQAQRDILAPSQINYVRNFPGLGTAVWEALTLQSKESAFSFINVQRLFDIIGVSVSQALLYSEYEPNDEFLKRQVVNLIAQFLEGIKNARGISDYTVVCDASNNTPAVANIGQLNVDIYIQPILPVRVIQVQLIATKQGVTFQELIATGGNF